MRYYRYLEGETPLSARWGGAPTYWFEVDDMGDATRQLVCYPDGSTLRYDAEWPADEYDGLHQMVVDGDEEWWTPYAIDREVFEAMWRSAATIDRDPGAARQLRDPAPHQHLQQDDDIPF